MKKFASTLCALVFSLAAGAAHADMKVKLGGGWNGKTVPAGQHCRLHGGKGSTPPMTVSGIPSGAAWIIVEFNDRDYRPLSTKGGHGVIGWPVKGSKTVLKPVPGKSARLPGGAQVVKKARSTGDYASPGYLPPCSGGRGNRYFADVKAVAKSGKVLARTRVEMGRY